MSRVFELKFKVGRINWVKVLFDIEDKFLMRSFYKYKYFHPDLSDNRCAYYVIKRRFSTTTLFSFKECLSKRLPAVALCYLKNELKLCV